MYIIQSSTKVPFNFHDFEKVYLMRRTIHLTSFILEPSFSTYPALSFYWTVLLSNVHITFISTYYHQEKVRVSLAASAHCDSLRQSQSEAGVWSPEPEPRPRPGSVPRGQSRYDDLLWLSLQSTFTTECPDKKESFFPLPQLFRDFFIRTPCPKVRQGLGNDRKD